MSECLGPQCTNAAPSGFVTCSDSCALAWRNAGVESKPVPQEDPGWTDAKGLSEIMGVHYQTVCMWARVGKIPCDRSRGPKKIRFHIKTVKESLRDESERSMSTPVTQVAPIRPELPPPPPQAAPQIDSAPIVPLVRAPTPSRGRYGTVETVLRDIASEMMLEQAEELRRTGDHPGAYAVLRDFLLIDRKLSDIFSGRNA